jgi:hypothetical protein
MMPSKEMIDDIYRVKVQTARTMTPEDKFFLGPRLFERSCRIMLDGLRDENPDVGDARLKELLSERLARLRRIRGTNEGR